jgi:hypothetical protein
MEELGWATYQSKILVYCIIRDVLICRVVKSNENVQKN